MNLTKEDIVFIRLYKQGLIKKFDNISELFNLTDIQAQNINSSIFNIFQRINSTDIEFIKKYLNESTIRTWFVRNTLHYCSKNNYAKIVFVNNLIGNWFERLYLKTKENIEKYNLIKKLCNNKTFLSTKELIQDGADRYLVSNWGGAFIQLVKDGFIINKNIYSMEVVENLSPPFINKELLAELVLQYFRMYSPARIIDFKHWLGANINIDENIYSLLKRDYKLINNYFINNTDFEILKLKTKIPLIILNKFDNICLAYSDKSWLVNPCFIKNIWNKAGIVEAVILVEGEIVATWRKKNKTIIIFNFKPINSKNRKEIVKHFEEFYGNVICKFGDEK